MSKKKTSNSIPPVQEEWASPQFLEALATSPSLRCIAVSQLRCLQSPWNPLKKIHHWSKKEGLFERAQPWIFQHFSCKFGCWTISSFQICHTFVVSFLPTSNSNEKKNDDESQKGVLRLCTMLPPSRLGSSWVGISYSPENQHDIGKSPFSIENTSSNGGFSIAMLVFRGVIQSVQNHPPAKQDCGEVHIFKCSPLAVWKDIWDAKNDAAKRESWCRHWESFYGDQKLGQGGACPLLNAHLVFNNNQGLLEWFAFTNSISP